MKTNHMEKIWNEFRLATIPLTAPKDQVTECKKSFYGGAAALMFLMIAQMDADAEPTENDLKFVDEISAELRTFVNTTNPTLN